MREPNDLTTGSLFTTLNAFAVPVLLALLLQALYGGVDLFIVGHFATTADVSGVASGSLMTQTITDFVAVLAVGVTIAVGQFTGASEKDNVLSCIGTAIIAFSILAIVLSAAMIAGARLIATWLQAPADALPPTRDYLFYCGIGMVFMVAYNLLAAIFRGLGDSKTPLFAVAVACAFNIVLDLLLVAGFHLGAGGAAIATAASQAFSVVISIVLIRRKKLLDGFHRYCLKLSSGMLLLVIRLGLPLALQDSMVSLSFLAIQILGNGIDVPSSAAVGIGEKLSLFLMLVPIAYSQAIAAFVAQNIGASQPVRARNSIFYGMGTSYAFAICIASILFIRADWVASCFTNDPAVIQAAIGYLHSYAFDCLLTAAMFCFSGYFTGRGNTLFVALQGIIGALCIRIPVAYFMRQSGSTSLFEISIGTPLASFAQTIICLAFYLKKRHHDSHL